MVDNKKIRQINKLLQKQMVQKFGVFAVALLVIGSVAFFGSHHNQASHAAGVGVLSITNASGTSTTLNNGSSVSVTLFEDSGTDLVNSVQASIGYNASQLQYVSMTEGTAFPTVAANSTGTAGIVRVGRATLATSPISGKNAIVTLNFKVIGTTGTSALTYDPAFSFIVRSTDNVNILTSSTGISFTLKLPTPTITTVAPVSGPTAGGTTITINGTNLITGSTVTVGGAAATGVTYLVTTPIPGGPTVSTVMVTATTPAHAAGAADVVVTNPDGQVARKVGGFSYLAPAPTLTAVAPTSGSTVGATVLTITGANFVTGATVTVGGTAATSVIFTSATSLTATAPAHAAGLVDVVVTNPDGQRAVGTGKFTYLIPAPTIASVTPAIGSVGGGTTLTISGSNFAGITGVTVGGAPATAVTVISSTSLTAVTPAAPAAGLVNVAVTNTSGTATKTGAFQYRAAAPVITSVTPDAVSGNGGSVIVLTGTGFVSGATVTIGGIAATPVTFGSSTSLKVTAPAHAAGLATIIVFNPDQQQGTLANAFTFLGLGDANNDGRVNAIDLSILISHDGQNYPPADFNGDGLVGAADMAILLGRWTW